MRGPEGNDIHLTNVPSIRLRFRQDLLESEISFINSAASFGIVPVSPEPHIKKPKVPATVWEMNKQISELENQLKHLKEAKEYMDKGLSI